MIRETYVAPTSIGEDKWGELADRLGMDRKTVLTYKDSLVRKGRLPKEKRGHKYKEYSSNKIIR